MQTKENSPLQENKMGVMPVGKLLLTMSAPMVASMLFQALYNIVDSVFVSRLGQNALNAVSLAFPFQMLTIAFAVGTGVGMNALVSRSLGQKNQMAADRAANTGAVMMALFGILFAILGFSFGTLFYTFQTENQQIIHYGSDYIHVAIGCCFFLFGQMYFERLLQATGRTALAMIPQVVGAVINTILDPIMIFGLFGFPRLEVQGAAVATVCGQTIAAIIGLILNLRYNPEIHLKLKEMRFHFDTVKEILRIGIPSTVMQAIGSVMNVCLNLILIQFTEAATAVFGAYFKIQSFIFMPVLGLNNAMVPIMSYNYGAKREDRYRKTLKLSIIAAVTIMSLGTIFFESIPGTLIGIFNPTEEMLSVGKIAFRVIGVHFPIAGFCIVCASVFQALNQPKYSLIVSICRQLGVLLPVAYIISLFGNLNFIWLCFPIAEIVSLTLSALFLRKTLRAAKQDVSKE